MNLNYVNRAEDRVELKNVLVSTADKSGLDRFVPELLRLCPGVRFFSTGGTYALLAEILEGTSGRLQRVADYTGQAEMQGGLVKTLDYKIYLGLLSETFNTAHQADLRAHQAHPFDMTVVNLYPFEATVADIDSTLEHARGNIDIGGPCMLRASAKNFLRIAPVCDPGDYPTLLKEIAANRGATGLEQRFRLARKAFAHTAAYDTAISGYLARFESVSDLGLYTIAP